METASFSTVANRVSRLQVRASATFEGGWPGGSLAGIWGGLISGQFSVVSTSTNSHSASLCLELCGGPLNERRSVVALDSAIAFDRILGGTRQKVLAFDLGVSVSTVAAMLHRVLETMGLKCTFSRMPLAIPLLRHAIGRPQLVKLRIETECAGHAAPRLVLCIPRCDASLESKLTRTESEVARQLLEGHSYLQMSRDRHASIRTIANQVASIYRKLNVSSRFELLHSAAQLAWSPPVAASPASLLPTSLLVLQRASKRSASWPTS